MNLPEEKGEEVSKKMSKRRWVAEKGKKGEEGTKRREKRKRKEGTYMYMKMKCSSPIPNSHMYTYRLMTGVCCLNYTFRQKSYLYQLEIILNWPNLYIHTQLKLHF